MRRCLTAILVVGLVSLVNTRASAQLGLDPKDVAAYVGLSGTPIGALSPIMVSPGTKGEKAFDNFSGRFSHFSPKGGGDGSNQFGGTWYHQAGMNAAVSGTVGYLAPGCTGCDGVILAGADVHSTLWDNAAAKSSTRMSINLQGSLGYGNTDGGNMLSAAVGVPFAMSVAQASKSSVGLFVTPGYGWGRVSGGGASESGMLPLVGVGGSWTSASGMGLHVSYNKIIQSDLSGNNFGVGFSWKR